MSKALIVKLGIRQWGATRTDKEISEEVARQKKADADAGKYVKNLIDRSALKEVRAKAQELRDKHKELTRPWDDDGRRLIPLGLAPQYEYEIDGLRAEFEAAVDQFVQEYPSLKNEAINTLGEMFNPADYPDDIADRFGVTLDYEPVPEAEHAPKGYEKAVEEAMRRKMKESADQLFHRVVNALSEVNRKLAAHQERIEAGDKRGRFRLSVMEELTALTDLLPALNIEGDPFLDGVAARIRRELAGVDPEQLRDDERTRKETMAEVEAILKEMEKADG